MMKKIHVAVFGLAAIAAFAKPNWKPLFNGTAFGTDWYIAGDKNFWKIDPADSSIVGFSNSGTPYTMVFSTRKDFDQFTVKYSYRLKAGCSGFFFRSKDTPSDQGLVNGTQVEAKYEAGQREVGSLYVHPAPRWVVQHTAGYDKLVAPNDNVYQKVVLTVKNPYVYVNINGKQVVGNDPAEIALGARREWQYTGTQLAQAAGQFGLQIHSGQQNMDVRFKDIAILEGCGNSTAPAYDGANVAGMNFQPAVYQDNGTCTVSNLPSDQPGALAGYFGGLKAEMGRVELQITFPKANSLDIINLDGKTVFSGSAPGAHTYKVNSRLESGIYFAKLHVGNNVASKKILIP
jgi:hypothetical protein